MSQELLNAAYNTLPTVRSSRSQLYKDDTLLTLSVQSRTACSRWLESGRPLSGPLYEEKCRLRWAVRQRVCFCAARAERRRVQRREKLFALNDHRSPWVEGEYLRKLKMSGEFISNPATLFEAPFALQMLGN